MVLTQMMVGVREKGMHDSFPQSLAAVVVVKSHTPGLGPVILTEIAGVT